MKEWKGKGSGEKIVSKSKILKTQTTTTTKVFFFFNMRKGEIRKETINPSMLFMTNATAATKLREKNCGNYPFCLGHDVQQ